VSDVSGLRRHLGSKHYQPYIDWCNANGFTSMIPKDTKARKASEDDRQQKILGHLVEKPQEDVKIPYSERNFLRAVLEWVVGTDQPLSASEHPLFRQMIEIASRCKDAITIPNRHVTRKEIISLFKVHIRSLREKFTV
ncbi:hypothetical protein SCHPADRAFT_812629, partial [Schizopora paradoxa]